MAVTTEVVRWYLQHHHHAPSNPGFPGMYCDPGQVGHLAVEREALVAGEAQALHRALVVTVMFQTMRDELVRRRLRSFTRPEAMELVNGDALASTASGLPCGAGSTTTGLREECDLHLAGGRPTCTRAPVDSCQMKRHTRLLRRYGHFGKVPTSLALMVREAGGGDLPGMYELARGAGSPREAAIWLTDQLARAWRVSSKLSAMFLSLVANPDVLPGAPWRQGLDWTYFVVIDTNVDSYLQSVGYRGPWTYRARRAFLAMVSERIDLTAIDPELQRYNPRIVQQAAYLFMSASNRRGMAGDCFHFGVCQLCPPELKDRCRLVATPGD